MRRERYFILSWERHLSECNSCNPAKWRLLADPCHRAAEIYRYITTLSKWFLQRRSLNICYLLEQTETKDTSKYSLMFWLRRSQCLNRLCCHLQREYSKDTRQNSINLIIHVTINEKYTRYSQKIVSIIGMVLRQNLANITDIYMNRVIWW